MTDTYLAADMTNAFITLARLNLRNLDNQELAPFYSGPELPEIELADRLSAAQALTNSAGLGAIPEFTYIEQTRGRSVNLFKSFLNASGIESEYVDDLIEVAANPQTPDLGLRSAFVTKKSATPNLAISDIRDRIRNETDASTAEHLAEPALLIVADADPYAAVRIKNMRQYITRYLVTPTI